MLNQSFLELMVLNVARKVMEYMLKHTQFEKVCLKIVHIETVVSVSVSSIDPALTIYFDL